MKVYVCQICDHPDYDHSQAQGECSMGWCSCTLMRSNVRVAADPHEVTPRAAYDPQTGEWHS